MNKLEQAARQASYVLYRFHTEFTPDEVSIYNNLREALVGPELNLNCKSVQKRLATSWGYVKAEQQEPVAWVEVERGIPMFMNFTENYKPNINNGIAPLYAAPVRTKDLTDRWALDRDDIDGLCQQLKDALEGLE